MFYCCEDRLILAVEYKGESITPGFQDETEKQIAENLNTQLTYS